MQHVNKIPCPCGRSVLAAAFVALAITVPGTGAAETVRAVGFSKTEKADIARVEAYLNSIKTIRSRFLQLSSNGAYSEGNIFFSRPGRMRIEYDPPSPILIVANGSQLIYFDKKLNQVSYMGLDSSPAGILISKNISFFSGKLTLTHFKKTANAIRLGIIRTEDPESGELTLVLSDKPLFLKKWEITDAQGITTTVTLTKTRFGLPLNSELFHFKRPRKKSFR